MNSEKERQELEELYRFLREEDRDRSPDFERTFQAAEERSRKGGWHRAVSYKFAAAAALVLLILIPLFWTSSESEPESIGQQVEFYEWESPTDFMLEMPGDSVYGSIPEISTDLSDWGLATNGDEN